MYGTCQEPKFVKYVETAVDYIQCVKATGRQFVTKGELRRLLYGINRKAFGIVIRELHKRKIIKKYRSHSYEIL